MGLPGSCHGETARRAANHLARRLPKLSSARRRAARERRPFLLARAGFARQQRQSMLPTLLGNASVLGLPLCARLAIPPEYSRRRGEPLRVKPVLSSIARSDPVAFDRNRP